MLSGRPALAAARPPWAQRHGCRPRLRAAAAASALAARRPPASRQLGGVSGASNSGSGTSSSSGSSAAEPVSLTTMDATGEASMQVSIDRDPAGACSTLRVTGPGQPDCMLLLTGGLFSEGFRVLQSSFRDDEGAVEFAAQVAAPGGGPLNDAQAAAVARLVAATTARSPLSVRPAIYGAVAEAELARLQQLSLSGEQGGGGGRVEGGAAPEAAADAAAAALPEAAELEAAATRVAVAAARFSAAERAYLAAAAKGDAAEVAAAEGARTETASFLERAIAAIEAVITSRRAGGAKPAAPPDEPASVADALRRQLLGAATPQPQQAGTGPGAGDGYEIFLQGFNWESHKGGGFWRHVKAQAEAWAEMGFTAVWLPPPSDSVSPQGYLPRDLYVLDSAYGSERELRSALAALKRRGLKPVADIVINHRCASHQEHGKWNRFGGRLAWDASAICSNNPAWGGRGGRKTGDDYPAAPNIDHTQERIREDITGWLRHLKAAGFDGWRLDFSRGYAGKFVKSYVDATVPALAFGEYWDSLDYSDGVLNYNQDAHRQRTVNWCDATGGTAAAFDFTTKGILQEALGRNELWRLVDAQGRPPGMVGLWPSRAVTFIDNHDTGSTLAHWPWPQHHLHEGYAYILTHPGTPCVFIDHLTGDAGLRKLILELIALRKAQGLHARSKVTIRKAAGDVYAATVDDKVAVKLGRGDWSPNGARIDVGQREWKLTASGHRSAVWVAVK